jgi:hypothetical protein
MHDVGTMGFCFFEVFGASHDFDALCTMYSSKALAALLQIYSAQWRNGHSFL